MYLVIQSHKIYLKCKPQLAKMNTVTDNTEKISHSNYGLDILRIILII